MERLKKILSYIGSIILIACLRVFSRHIDEMESETLWGIIIVILLGVIVFSAIALRKKEVREKYLEQSDMAIKKCRGYFRKIIGYCIGTFTTAFIVAGVLKIEHEGVLLVLFLAIGIEVVALFVLGIVMLFAVIQKLFCKVMDKAVGKKSSANVTQAKQSTQPAGATQGAQSTQPIGATQNGQATESAWTGQTVPITENIPTPDVPNTSFSSWQGKKEGAIPLEKTPVTSNSRQGVTIPLFVEEDKAATWKICALAGIFAGQEFVINGVLQIGRNPNAQVSYPPDFKRVSKVHCILLEEDGAIFIRDENSTNGTFLGKGIRLEPEVNYCLEEGDVFYLAEINQRFCLEKIE